MLFSVESMRALTLALTSKPVSVLSSFLFGTWQAKAPNRTKSKREMFLFIAFALSFCHDARVSKGADVTSYFPKSTTVCPSFFVNIITLVFPFAVILYFPKKARTE